MTLEFSARQNYLAARFSNPSYVNVFLGRLNADVADNQLGSGNLAGEKATLASQAGVDEVNGELKSRPPVRQIAASLRSADQAPALAGVDVFTMPLKVAEGVLANPPQGWKSRKGENYQPEIDLKGAAREAGSQVLWEIEEGLKKLARSLDELPPRTPAELVRRAREAGIKNLFPEFSKADEAALAGGGKIPKHAAWKERIARGELAIDTLLNAAGYFSFAKDQQALDDRIRGLLGK
jgi:transaldolase